MGGGKTILQISHVTEFVEKQATGRNVVTEQATNGFHSLCLPPHVHTHTHSQKFHLTSHPGNLTHHHHS